MKSCKRALLTAYDYAVFYFCLIEFCVLSFAWSAIAAVLHLLLPEKIGRKVGRFGIMMGFRIFLGSLALSGRFRFDLRALEALRSEEALLIAPNHPSLWDAVIMASRLPKVACIMKAKIINDFFVGGGARLARYVTNDSLRQMIVMAVEDLRRGNQVLLFPEGTRTLHPPIGKLKGSLGVIASRAQVPVQTLLIEVDSPFLAKGWPIYKKPPLPLTYRVRLGRRFPAPVDSAAFMAELEQYFIEQLGHPAALPATPLAAREAAAID